jgi:drug/metabolite transporter (DMT)-like permease
MGIFLGLFAAAGWGTGDFLVRDVTRRIGSYSSLLFMQIFGLLFIGVFALLSGEYARLFSVSDPGVYGFMLIQILVSVFGTLMLYQAFATGMLSIVSPIASSYAAVTLVLSLLSGERLTTIRLIGFGFTLGGIILASIEPRRTEHASDAISARRRFPPGVGYALAAAALYGMVFWLQGFYVVPVVGGTAAVLATRVGAVVLLLLLALLPFTRVRTPGGRTLGIIVLVGVIDTLAYLATSIGTSTEQVSIVTVLSSLFSAWTILLAWVFLRERPARVQWLGIVLILIGIVLVSVGI